MKRISPVWKPVVGWEGCYEVSSRGDVRSVARSQLLSNGQTRYYKSRLLKPQFTSDGRHLHVQLRKPGKSKFHRVHTLVLEAFVGPCPDGMMCRHLNGDGHDNRKSNLVWGTASENQRDRVVHGMHHYATRDRCGKGHKYTPENTYRRTNGARRCKTCHLAEQRSRRTP